MKWPRLFKVREDLEDFEGSCEGMGWVRRGGCALRLLRWLLLGAPFFHLLGAGRAQDSGTASPPVVSSPAKESPFVPPPVFPTSALDYMITPEDILDIYVFEVPEISRLYQVSPTGFITLPLLSEPIAAAGLSLAQLANVITAKFQETKLLSKPQVTVSVKETRLHSVVIAGAVKKPQVYPLFGPAKLLQVLSQSGGLADDAGEFAIINRGEIGTRLSSQAGSGPEGVFASSVSVDVRRLLETGEESLNLVLYPGDRVTVQRAGIIYVLGAVSRPGGYPLKDSEEEMTVLKVLALAGDVTSSAKRSKLVLLRKKEPASERREEVALDLKKIIGGRSPDTKLYSGDILLVPENGKLKAVRQVVGTGVGMGAAITTGVIIYRH